MPDQGKVYTRADMEIVEAQMAALERQAADAERQGKRCLERPPRDGSGRDRA